MLFSRPSRTFHPALRLLAAVMIAATAVTTFYWNPPQVHAQVVWKQPLSLAPAPAGSDTGDFAPRLRTVEVDGSFGVATSTTPTLVWRNVPAGVGQVRFALYTLDARQPAFWQVTVAVGGDRTARAMVPNGRLAQGRSYRWSATATTNASTRSGPHALTVDVQRAEQQQLWSGPGISIAQVTGEPIFTWDGPELPTTSGGVGWNLTYRPTNPDRTGLPRGWQLDTSGIGLWDTLTLNPDASVTLTTITGWTGTFIERAGFWEPVLGRDNVTWPNGQPSLVARSADGSFSITDGNRTVTTFPSPSEADRTVSPLQVWTDDAPTMRQGWLDDRLRLLQDPVTGNLIQFEYGGSPVCDYQPDRGFIRPPAGELCSVQDWQGNVIMLQYLRAPDGSTQLGRIVSGLGQGRMMQLTDLNYDRAGRLSTIRDARANMAIAAGVVGGLSDRDVRATTQIGYDAEGRVTSVTSPAGLRPTPTHTAAEQVRARQTYAYANGVMTVRADGVQTSSGFLMRTVNDPATMLPRSTQDATGGEVVFTFDDDGHLTEQVDRRSGSRAIFRYDDQGRAIEAIGPSTAPLTSPSVPRSTTHYDEDRRGRDWTGLATTFWRNATFSGTPADATTGPILPGAAQAVANLAFNWAGDPTGGNGPWSARLTGLFQASRAGQHTFQNSTNARMWVNGRLCGAVGCQITLDKNGTATVQIDVSAPTGGPAGLNATVATPDGRRAAVPTAQLRPNYGLATTTTTREFVSGQVRNLTTRTEFDPVSGRLMATETPLGNRITRGYEAYDPARGQYGRSTSVTDASGRTTRFTYHGANATAADCVGQSLPQAASVNELILPGSRSIANVSVAGATTVRTTSSTSTTCATTSPDGASATATTTGLGPDVVVTQNVMRDGNPLATTLTTRANGRTTIVQSFVDLNGNEYKSVDAHGTITTTTWDPRTQLTQRVTERTKAGQTRHTDYTYNGNGDVETISVNNRTIATYTYDRSGVQTGTTYANGVQERISYDANFNVSAITRTTPNGQTFGERLTHSPTGRILSRQLSGTNRATAEIDYVYDADGRLVDTRISGTQKTTLDRVQVAYDGVQAQGGNRSSTTERLGTGKTRTSTFAYAEDNSLTSSTDPQINGAVTSDAAGRVTRIGATSLQYDAAGNLLSASDGTHTYAFTSDASGPLGVSYTSTENGAARTLDVRLSGSLVLDGAGRVAAQIIQASDRASVILDENGAPASWSYNDEIGNVAWRGAGAQAVSPTMLYAPDGQRIDGQRAPVDPTTAIELIDATTGWQDGAGVSTLPLATPIMLVGARQYAPDAARFLQPDPSIDSGVNVYQYAAGDPINFGDPTGYWSIGRIIGTVAAVAVGIAIGSLTFGIGSAGIATYGFAQLALQVAVGAVAGAITATVGNVAAQVIDTGSVDWADVGASAWQGVLVGGAAAAAGALISKVVIPSLKLSLAKGALLKQQAAYNQAGDTFFGMKAQAARQLTEDGIKPPFYRGFFSKAAWKAEVGQAGGQAAKRKALSFSDLYGESMSRKASAIGSNDAASMIGHGSKQSAVSQVTYTGGSGALKAESSNAFGRDSFIRRQVLAQNAPSGSLSDVSSALSARIPSIDLARQGGFTQFHQNFLARLS